MNTFLQDLRYALRSLRRAGAFTTVAILTLALAIGANSAIFSVVNGVLLRPLPYPESERLVALHRETAANEADISLPDAEDMRRELTRFEGIGLFFPGWAFDLTGQGDPERLVATVAEPEYFTVLRTAPLLGRVYAREDRDARLTVLSHQFWQRRLNGEPVLGRTLILSDVPYTIVGVMPANFSTFDPAAQLWVSPAAATPWAAGSRGTNNFEVVARLAPGTTVTDATAELRSLTTRLAEQYPSTNARKVLLAEGVVALLTAVVRPAVWALFAAVGLVLLIASANLASLLLVRAETRATELAVRTAIGAGRSRLIRAALAECLVLAVPGGALGLGLAVWGTQAILLLAGAALPRAGEVQVDGAVLAFTTALTLGTTLLFGLLPALRMGRTDPARALGAVRGGPGRQRQRTLSGLVIIEVTLAAVLLVGALLLGRSFQALQRVDLGFRAPGLVSIDITLPESRYGSWAAQTAAFAAIIDRVNAVPGVQGAATVIGGPLNVGGAVGHSFRIDGWSPPDPSVDPSARSRPVGGDYFRVMDIPILAGRPFDDRDVATAMPVAIVNQSFARGVWGSDDPIGHRLAWRFSDGPPRWITVVGVAGDVRAGSLRDGDEPAVYTPYPQREPGWERFGVLMVRGDRAAADLTREVRRAVLSVDPGLPIGRSLTMEDAAGEVLTAERLGASIFVVFSLVAALMAGQGVYGLLAFVVSTRRREMGIRLALGAAPREVVALILSHGVALVATGLALGLIVGSALSRLVSAQLYGISSGDPLTYLTAATGLMLVAVVAAWLPAQRAAGVDPGVVLREE